jgi:hypothetical protein
LVLVALMAQPHLLLIVHPEEIQLSALLRLMVVVVAAKLLQPVILAAPVEVLGVEIR